MIPLLLPLALGVSAHADDTRAHFTVQPRVVVDLQHDRAAEDVAEAWTWVSAHAEGPARQGRWFLAIQADHVVLAGQTPGGDVEAATQLWVGESGWAGELGPIYVRAGHLVERWGSLDILPVTDVLSARDLRAGPLVPVERARVPAPTLHLELGDDRLRAGLLLLPFGAASRVPLWGTDYSLLKQGMVEGLLSDASGWSDDPLLAEPYAQILGSLEEGIRQLDAQTRRGLEGGLASTGMPSPLWQAGELGAEVQSRLGPVHIALTGAWMRSRVPAPQLDPTLARFVRTGTLPALAELETLLADDRPTVWSADRPRTATAGVQADTLLGSVGIRTEANYSHAAVIPTPWFGYTLSPMWAAGLGVDRAASTLLTITAEARWRHLVTPPPAALMTGTPDHFDAAAGLRSSLARERLTAELFALYDITFAELGLQPALRFRPLDTFDLGLGAVLFSSPTPAAATWRDALDYRGGLIGYASDTSALWFDARWMR